MQINNLFLMIFPRMSLHCMLVPVQYREYEYGLFIFKKSVNYFEILQTYYGQKNVGCSYGHITGRIV